MKTVTAHYMMNASLDSSSGAAFETVSIPSRGSRPGRREYLIVFALSALLCSAGAVHLGQDANFDQRNYHIYTVHAWLTGRGSLDLAPSQIQTWLNPISHVPASLLILFTPPIVAGATLGALAGTNGLALWVLARALFGTGTFVQLFCAIAATACGLTGSFFIGFLGTTFSENLCSPFVVAALACIVIPAGRDSPPSPAQFLAAGLCLGAACGLKFTHVIYAVALTASLIVLWPVYRLRLAHLLMFAAGGATAAFAVGGYWAVRLWSAFGNPMFPFFNGVFRSPWYDQVNFADARFLPASVVAAASKYPFEWLLGINHTNELLFREPRFALVAVLLPIAIIVALVRKGTAQPAAAPGGIPWSSWNFWLCSLFFALSYAVWAKQFSYQRYALSLELLTGIMLVIALCTFLRSYGEVAVVCGALITAVILVTRAPDWRRVPYERDWFGFPPAEAASSTMYVMIGAEPTSYVIPFMPANDRFIRIDGNMPLEPGRRLGRRAAAAIADFNGPLRSLVNTEAHDVEREVLASERSRLRRFGLDLVDGSCQSFRSRMDTFWTCELRKTPQRK